MTFFLILGAVVFAVCCYGYVERPADVLGMALGFLGILACGAGVCLVIFLIGYCLFGG